MEAKTPPGRSGKADGRAGEEKSVTREPPICQKPLPGGKGSPLDLTPSPARRDLFALMGEPEPDLRAIRKDLVAVPGSLPLEQRQLPGRRAPEREAVH